MERSEATPEFPPRSAFNGDCCLLGARSERGGPQEFQGLKILEEGVYGE